MPYGYKNKPKSSAEVTPKIWNKHKTNSSSGTPVETAKTFTPAKCVDEMTSSDFQLDVNAHIDVQSYRLRDRAFFKTFSDYIMRNRHLFRDRIVLDVNCGLGLLSLFSAKAGARRVYAVDSSNAVDYLKQIASDNGYADVVHVIKGNLEEIELPVATVQVIVSNWLGHSLLFESACDKVIYARDKWLDKQEGVILPDVGKLYMAAIENGFHRSEHIDWWCHVYGFRMDCIRKCALTEPVYDLVSPQQVVSTEFCVKTLDLNTATVDDLKVRSKYFLQMLRGSRIDGIVTYFTASFPSDHTHTTFSTSPEWPSSHWQQTVFYFERPIFGHPKQAFYGGLEMSPLAIPCVLQVDFEMFTEVKWGTMHFVNEMRWFLKPHCLQLRDAKKDPGASRNTQQNRFPN